MGRAVDTSRTAGVPDLARRLSRAHRRALELRCVLAEESDTEPGRRIADTACGRRVALIERRLSTAVQNAANDPAECLRLREQALAEIEPLLPSPEGRRVKLEVAS